MRAKLARLRAYRLGFIDGWRSPYELSMGRTWTDDRNGENEAYDHGANHGQFVRSPLHNQRREERKA